VDNLTQIYQYQTGAGKESFSYKWETVYRLLKEYRLRCARKYISKSGNLLEIGPADAGMSMELAKMFDRVVIIEPTHEFADDLKRDLDVGKNVNIVNSAIKDYKKGEKYDYIILSHVLEHIENDSEVLKKLKEMLEEEGRVFIMVPNANCINRKIGIKLNLSNSPFDLNERDKKIGHLRVYNFQSLIKVCESAGFKVINKGGLFIKPFPNEKMEKICSEELLRIFMELGEEYPEISTEIYVVCENIR